MKFHHLGVAVKNIESNLKTYTELLGYTLRSGPFDDPIQKVKVCFLGTDNPSDALIELVEPLSADSPVQGVLTRGGGAYHMCFETTGFDQGLEQLLSQGCLPVSKPAPAIAFGGRRIAWIYTPTRQLIELLESN